MTYYKVFLNKLNQYADKKLKHLKYSALSYNNYYQ